MSLLAPELKEAMGTRSITSSCLDHRNSPESTAKTSFCVPAMLTIDRRVGQGPAPSSHVFSRMENWTRGRSGGRRASWAACAAECAREGLRVAIVEAGMVGCGATAAGMGHLVVMDDSEAQFALTRYSQQLWDEVSDELPREVEHDACGTIWIAADDEEMAEAQRKATFYSQRGVSVEILDAHSLREAEPNLREGLVGGLRVPGDSVIYPPCAAQFFVDQARARGAEVFLGHAVEAVDVDGVRLRGGTSIAAGLIVNSAGSWSPLLTPGLEVKNRKGHLVITDRYPQFLRHQLVELGYLKSAHSLTADSVAFNIQPRKTGQLLIGSSRQFEVDDA